MGNGLMAILAGLVANYLVDNLKVGVGTRGGSNKNSGGNSDDSGWNFSQGEPM